MPVHSATVRNGPSPNTSSPTARSIPTVKRTAPGPMACAADDSPRSADDNHEGTVAAFADNGPLRARDVALPGSSLSAADPTHRTAHARRSQWGGRLRRDTRRPDAVGPEPGQAATPTTMYKHAAPGAPSRAVVCPPARPPSPSPKNHTPPAQTTVATTAGRAVRPTSSPTPIASWIEAKQAFSNAGWAAIIRMFHSTGPATQWGCPPAAGAMIPVAKPLVNMNG